MRKISERREKMIKIDVRKYCERCPHFEPEVVERPQADILTSYSVCDIVFVIWRRGGCPLLAEIPS